MRTGAPSLLPLFRSETQVGLLGLVMLQPDRDWSLGELAKQLDAPASSVLRELRRLVAAGLVTRDQRQRPHRYAGATESPAYEPLRDLLNLTVGVAKRLEGVARSIPGVEAAAIHGSWAAGTVRPDSDIDVVIVTAGDGAAAQRAVRAVEKEVARDIDVTVLRPDEFRALVRERNPFAGRILLGPRIDLVGDIAAIGDTA